MHISYSAPSHEHYIIVDYLDMLNNPQFFYMKSRYNSSYIVFVYLDFKVWLSRHSVVSKDKIYISSQDKNTITLLKLSLM